MRGRVPNETIVYSAAKSEGQMAVCSVSGDTIPPLSEPAEEFGEFRRLVVLVPNRYNSTKAPYHFARRFKVATGLPPHQYLIVRRVERAKQLLQQDRDFSLAEIAARAGFSDQSQFSQHFKRAVGVTPGQFRTSARIA